MPKTGANIYKRKDGRWEGRYIKYYSENGKAKYGYVYSKTYSDVKLKLKEQAAQAHLLREYSCAADGNITFAELSEKWLHYTENRVKASSLSTYSNTLKRHILPGIGHYKLKNLSDGVLKRFADEKMLCGKADGSGLSPKTVRDLLSIINSIIEYAEAENYMPKNMISIKYPKIRPEKMRVLSRDEQAKLEAVLLNDTDIYKFGVLVCLYTGLRIGEICALKWSDISLPGGVITVRQTLQRIKNIENFSKDENKTKIIIDKPKSGFSHRDIPIPNFLISGFERFRSENKNAFFLTGSETKFIEPRTYQNWFKAYIRESGIADANFHSLRHTFSTRCVETEFDIKSLSEILGHASVNITLNRYVHSSFDFKQKNMMKLNLISV